MKNSDLVEAGSAVDQSESSQSFMWTWKKESKCLRSERITSQNVPQIRNAQRIFERMTVISSQFCFTTKHCLLLQRLWTGRLYTYACLSLGDTRPRGRWVSPRLSGASQFKALFPVTKQNVIMRTSLATIWYVYSSSPFSKGPLNCLAFCANLEGSSFAVFSG